MTTNRTDEHHADGTPIKRPYEPPTLVQQLEAAVELFGVEDTAAAIREARERRR